MKYKKYSYLIITILMLIINVNSVFAEQGTRCYYQTKEDYGKIRLTILWDVAGARTVSNLTKVDVEKFGAGNYMSNSEGIANWWDSWNGWDNCLTDDTVCFEARYTNLKAANSVNSPHECPKYLVFENKEEKWFNNYYVWSTDSDAKAQKAENIAANDSSVFVGHLVSREDYYSEFDFEGLIDFDNQENPTCSDFETMFGDKDDPESIRYLINEILGYVRVIVPILIIVLGALDFAKAVIAAKEDNMKKAQTDFIKRVLIGVAVFFVPLLVDVIMEIAEIVWNGDYISCKLQ